jgi:hypothetical protein
MNFKPSRQSVDGNRTTAIRQVNQAISDVQTERTYENLTVKCKKAGDPRNRLPLASTCSHLVKGESSEVWSISPTYAFINGSRRFRLSRNCHFFVLKSAVISFS